MILDLFFDRIVILTLKENVERAERAKQELVSKNLSSDAQVYFGIRGSICKPPVWWKAGPGAWGCMQSHLRIVQDAMMDGVDNLLILEDDCVWQKNATPWVFKFLGQLPDDWEQVYFGGQHRNRGASVDTVRGKPAVLDGYSIHRTHAFGLKKSVMAAFCQHIMDANSYISSSRNDRHLHIDHQLEIAHSKKLWKVYAPSLWLAGQGENKSDINGRVHLDKWWHPIIKDCETRLPLVICRKPLEPEIMNRLHFGHHLAEDNPLLDEGIFGCPQDENIKVLRVIAREAYAHQRLPGMFFHADKYEYFKQNWPGGVILGEDLSLEGVENLCDYPASGVIKHPWINP